MSDLLISDCIKLHIEPSIVASSARMPFLLWFRPVPRRDLVTSAHQNFFKTSYTDLTSPSQSLRAASNGKKYHDGTHHLGPSAGTP
ncbi:hypothetical protein PGTUg99_032538 [Puccinia graminis f. sp. tritici]|uniref:Uncharacterized protein n=1 Tax=Puccinia graminis f. sp. tritici TaxID=56615 RepID=A0A5B0RF41_PUCGR|nr:hypothetical protein PGTUg99_032538 [Puccinia graminis f. sp. tritici]